MNLPERVFDYVFVMVCECATRLSFEEAAQQVNDNFSFFWIVSCPLPLHVERLALCAYVIGCVCACVIE